MMNCEHCRNLLLDHLYGLLDEADTQAVRAHLQTCPACEAARADTARVQGLFAQAAKSSFPHTRFTPPAPALSHDTLPDTSKETPKAQPARAPSPKFAPALATLADGGRAKGFARRAARVLPWAVAAAVLLAIPGTVVPVLDIFARAQHAEQQAEFARRDAREAASAVAAVRSERVNFLAAAEGKLAAAEETRVALLDRWFEEQKLAVKSAAERKLTINVLKPATIQPGAPNDFLLVVRDARDRWESREMVAEVRASDAVLYTQRFNHEKLRPGEPIPIHLPAGVWAKVKPDAELTLVVSQLDGKTRTQTPVQEVRLAGPVFTTLLVTDKPTYRPGERLFFRSLTLDRVTFKPPAREQHLRYELLSGGKAHGANGAGGAHGALVAGLATAGTTELVRVGEGGRVDPVRMPDGQPVRGVGCGEFVLPPDLADGEYTLALRELPAPGAFAPTLPLPVTRTIRVQAAPADA
ncbi:MAG: zf-HC2 domain-containing protein, partial [Gemmataceae bacterium]|nr:zf-HC2 domain-containing protein [Gemmataceae bacterium]